MRLKQGFLIFFLALFLAACGTQTQLPEAPQLADDALGQISAAELEQAFDTTALAAQGGWNRTRENRFVLKKIVVGDGPKDQKYKVAVLCKVPGYNHKLDVVAAAYLKHYEYEHFYVPKKYVKCAAFEFKTFGDIVKFKLEQKHNNQHSGVRYSGTLHVWGEDTEYKASRFFYVKHGEAKFITYNEYKKVPTPVKDKTKVSFVKSFVDEHGKKVDITGKATFELICKIDGSDVVVDTFYFNSHRNYYYNKYYRGLDCYLKESFYDDYYKLVDVHFMGYTYTRYYYDDKNPFRSNVHSYDGKHATSGRFTIPSKGKLHFIMIDKLAKKEVERVPTCQGKKATVYVNSSGKIVGGPDDGDTYEGFLTGFYNMDNVIAGTDQRDQIEGGAGNDLICAGGGNDTVKATSGDDVVYGGDGNDALFGENGNDTLFGENGNDNLRGDSGDDTLTGGSGEDDFSGGLGTDTAKDYKPDEDDDIDTIEVGDSDTIS